MFVLDDVQELRRVEEAPECAALMASTEPWLTLGLRQDLALVSLKDEAKEAYAVRDASGIAGFVVLDMRGLVSGYIGILCVRPDCRSRGVGSLLIRWAENRIFRNSPNAFICVSSFNTGARRLYERLGFEQVGLLRDFIVVGHDELLLRKTRGAWSDFRNVSRSPSVAS